MRFLVDECVGPSIARLLREQGHDVFSVYEEARGIDDDRVIEMARAENRILITNDKDFGEKVYRESHLHRGIILLRIQDQNVPVKVAAVKQLLETHSDRLEGSFVVVTDRQIRFAKL